METGRGVYKIPGIAKVRLEGKLLRWDWLVDVLRHTREQVQYKFNRDLRRVISPDRKNLSEKSVFLIIGESTQRFSTEKPQYSYHGLLGGISEDNVIGVFGLWPKEFKEFCCKRPDLLLMIERMFAREPWRWKSVDISVTNIDFWRRVERRYLSLRRLSP